MKVCSNPLCPFGGSPQADGQFYARKARCRTCVRASSNSWGSRAKKQRAESPFVIDRERKTFLPIGPWREWLTQVESTLDEDANVQQKLADMLGVSERRLWGWRKDKHQRQVDLDSIDKALCALGAPYVLREIYPHLYLECALCGMVGEHAPKCEGAQVVAA